MLKGWGSTYFKIAFTHILRIIVLSCCYFYNILLELYNEIHSIINHYITFFNKNITILCKEELNNTKILLTTSMTIFTKKIQNISFITFINLESWRGQCTSKKNFPPIRV